jgi:asparagine synthase (glutamine-hydrolysing)
VLKHAARGIVPDAAIDRPKGYFPVPALSHLEGPVLDLVADALTCDAARSRDLFRGDVIREMLTEPNVHRSNLDGSTLWQLALLELWLQQLSRPPGDS